GTMILMGLLGQLSAARAGPGGPDRSRPRRGDEQVSESLAAVSGRRAKGAATCMLVPWTCLLHELADQRCASGFLCDATGFFKGLRRC
ncbi:hypothetical protein CTI14_37500, partial [Methylobacterium radiotolerans]